VICVFDERLAGFLNYFLLSELVQSLRPCELYRTSLSLGSLGAALIGDGDAQSTRASLYIKELIVSLSSP
jgi:hypothetical protein